MLNASALMGRLWLAGMLGVAANTGHAQLRHDHPQLHDAHSSHVAPGVQQPGQAVFAAVQEIVALLEADPTTDWTKVDVSRLHAHLIDMDEVFMRARAEIIVADTAVRILVHGEGATLGAIRRMVPAHAAMMNGHRGWRSRSIMEDERVEWILESDSAAERARIIALGFFGLLTLGSHHGPHHLAMARGQLNH